MTTVAELQDQVHRLLNDPTKEAYEVGLFLSGVSAALDAILPWTPKTSMQTITGDGGSVYVMPDDLYTVETCVVDATGEILPNAVIIPGHSLGSTIQGANNWLEYPNGSISFSKDLTVGETYTLYYLAHWDKPTDPSQLTVELEPPAYTHFAISLYVTAYMLIPSAISASEVRQFNTRVDSGNPEHNPMEQTTKYLFRLFAEEMNRHPRHQKAQR